MPWKALGYGSGGRLALRFSSPAEFALAVVPKRARGAITDIKGGIEVDGGSRHASMLKQVRKMQACATTDIASRKGDGEGKVRDETEREEMTRRMQLSIEKCSGSGARGA